jgi:hypothetical protein
MPEPTPIRITPGRAVRGTLRHDMPAVDEAALTAARLADRVIAAARAAHSERWLAYFEPLADRLRDDEPRGLRQVALRIRAAYGPKDSVRDVLPTDATDPLLDAIDRLLKQLNRREAS